ncbi:MAG: PadR family transcriptional regulator [Longimicrobiales bacterium]
MSPRVDAASLYGTLNLLVLRAVADGPLHGLAIARRIAAESDDVLRVEEGALYPALHRLEGDGLLAAEWGTSDNNRRARFYRLTDAGRARLEAESARWRVHADAVARLLAPG